MMNSLRSDVEKISLVEECKEIGINEKLEAMNLLITF